MAALYYRRGCLANLAGTGGSADLARALELLPEGEPTALRAQVLVDLAATQVFGGDAAAADRTAHAALDVAEQVDTPAVAARAHAFIALSAAESDTAAAHFASARAAADDPATLLSVLTWQCAFDVAMGRYAAAVDAVHEGLRTANDSFQFTDKGPILLVKWAQALNALGQWATARTVIDEALAGPLPGLSAAALSLCHADITLAQGDRATAQQAVDAAAGLLDDNPWATQYRLELRAVQCKLAVHCDDFSHATALLTSTVAEAGVRAYPNDLWPLLALAARLPDPPDLADTAAQLAIASPVAAAHRAVYVAATTGAPALWTEAAASWHALGRPFDHAQALLGYAEAALAHGDRGKARTALKEAADVATGLGATSLHDSVRRTAEHARLPLADSGPDSGRTDAAPSTSGLTRRELDVLRLVSRGLTNRQIAAELFISGNTAGVHISRILAKLGVATRTEAAAYAHRHGLA
ncbi:MAG: response regulator transcription factor [Mycobacteriaceae bacterium]|nr:response regulator transcription factor [Mycobacteriaceae bacterium]